MNLKSSVQGKIHSKERRYEQSDHLSFNYTPVNGRRSAPKDFALQFAKAYDAPLHCASDPATSFSNLAVYSALETGTVMLRIDYIFTAKYLALADTFHLPKSPTTSK